MIDQVYVSRLESAYEALLLRNADLCTALTECDPNNKVLSKPMGYSRAKRIANVLDAALDHVYGIDSESEDDAYDALVTACDYYVEYWDVKQTTKDKGLRMKRYWKDARG